MSADLASWRPPASRQAWSEEPRQSAEDSDDDLDLWRPKRGRHRSIPGLPNKGNTCFMNAVLQCLLNSPGNLLPVLRHLARRTRLTADKARIVLRFADLAEEYAEETGFSLDEAGDSPALEGLRKAVAVLDPRYASCQQQDAYEFLGALLEGLDESLLSLYRSRCGEPAPVQSIIRVACGITTYAVRRCHGCRELVRTDTATDTALRLPLVSPAAQLDEALRLEEERQPVTLRDLMVALRHPEVVQDYDCEQCREDARRAGLPHKRCSVTLQAGNISDTSEMLVIALYRFLNVVDSDGDFEAVKVRRRVAIPTQLNLATGDYRLYGVVSHLGSSLDHGHYVAAVRSLLDGQWYDCDDELVRPLQLRSLHHGGEVTATRPGADPYILFYHRASQDEAELMD